MGLGKWKKGDLTTTTFDRPTGRCKSQGMRLFSVEVGRLFLAQLAKRGFFQVHSFLRAFQHSDPWESLRSFGFRNYTPIRHAPNRSRPRGDHRYIVRSVGPAPERDRRKSYNEPVSLEDPEVLDLQNLWKR